MSDAQVAHVQPMVSVMYEVATSSQFGSHDGAAVGMALGAEHSQLYTPPPSEMQLSYTHEPPVDEGHEEDEDRTAPEL